MKNKIVFIVPFLLMIGALVNCTKSTNVNPRVRFYISEDQFLTDLDSFKIKVFDTEYELSHIEPESYSEYKEVAIGKEYTYYTGEAYMGGEMNYGEGRVYLSHYSFLNTVEKSHLQEVFKEEEDYLSEFKFENNKKYTVVMIGIDFFVTIDE